MRFRLSASILFISLYMTPFDFLLSFYHSCTWWRTTWSSRIMVIRIGCLSEETADSTTLAQIGRQSLRPPTELLLLNGLRLGVKNVIISFRVLILFSLFLLDEQQHFELPNLKETGPCLVF